ncbi:hypothetical protein ES703_82684 [subsurface metagenome]
MLRFFGILACLIGIRIRRYIHVCVVILRDRSGNTTTTLDRVSTMLSRAQELLDQCNIQICVESVNFLTNRDLMSGVHCGVRQLVSREYHWFEEHACKRPLFASSKPLTLYFVDSMADANACTIPRTSYAVLTDGANGASMVHELGHHADLTHRDDSQNIMFAEPSDTKDKLTKWQCCMIRTSAFLSEAWKCEKRSLKDRLSEVRGYYARQNRNKTGGRN